MSSVWYLRRAVPWAALLGNLAAASLLVTLVRWEDGLAGIGLPLVAVLTVAAAAFVLDEPALPVTAVTPRHGWAERSRLAVAVLPLLTGLGLLLAAPGNAQGAEWTLLVAGLGGAVLLLAAVASRRGVPRPGAGLASAVVLLGLSPLVVGVFVELPALYPFEAFTERVTAFWVALLAASGAGLAHLVLLRRA